MCTYAQTHTYNFIESLNLLFVLHYFQDNILLSFSFTLKVIFVLMKILCKYVGLGRKSWSSDYSSLNTINLVFIQKHEDCHAVTFFYLPSNKFAYEQLDASQLIWIWLALDLETTVLDYYINYLIYQLLFMFL